MLRIDSFGIALASHRPLRTALCAIGLCLCCAWLSSLLHQRSPDALGVFTSDDPMPVELRDAEPAPGQNGGTEPAPVRP